MYDNRSLVRLLLTSDHDSSTLFLAQIALVALVLLNLLSLLFSWYAIPILLATFFLFVAFAGANLLYVSLRDELIEDQIETGNAYADLCNQFHAFEQKQEIISTDLIDTYERCEEMYRILYEQEKIQKERQKYIPKNKRRLPLPTLVLETVQVNNTTQELVEQHEEEQSA